ncbi:BTAD domain-containing putative transcriptional regulator [Thermomonospora umbrina]|uniref:DNA-binding SARP family transcriptional activator n=1 Tax=Thermomonospora umbrina TaxID=111806 RepID=A0A3D9SFZ1_9ACTN|nr:BTAD domain-containing putative transcriptional regulator [Thermomonospora umbrina]REE94809.1 DNA-binding SARP family transcriptional activator [Thermomonospora umbrina]
MRFNLLGPLEVIKDDVPVPLGGLHRRAALGLLLLHPNAVVATADLVRALWDDDPPATARKMVQNAVAALRDVLAAEERVSLRTVAPGYMLRLDPHRIDLADFRDLVRDGRTAFRAEAWDTAARHLREALGLWRGPVLADLSEIAAAWPEPAALQEERLTALEDCAEAELALGLHRELLGELGAVAEAEPARERLCGLVMLALYRCGQQAEALAAFHRTRTVLVEEFGLDPAPELHRLQRAILAQDPDLLVPASKAAPAPAPPAPPRERSKRPMAERRHASVVLVEARVNADTDDPERVDEVLTEVDRIIDAEAAHFGGLVRGPLGPYRLVVFGVPRAHGDDAARAIGAALAIRRRLGTARPATARLAVATGEVLAVYRDEHDAEPAELTGAVLDACRRMLAHARPDGVRVCDRTRRAAGRPFGRRAGDPVSGWNVTDDRPPAVPPPPNPPFVGREKERERLWELLDETLRERRSHLVTVVGEPGIGKSRLVSEFGREVRERVGAVRVVSGDAASLGIARPDPWRPGCPADRPASEASSDGASGPGPHRLDVLAARTPLVAVVEDLHRTPAAFLDLVTGMHERPDRGPLLVIATTRPERPIDAAPDASAIVLGPLADTEITAMAGTLSPDLLPLIGGNPLFAQEYARLPPHRPAGPPPIPPRVRDLLTVRLDALPVAERLVLRSVAVFEPAASAEGVAAVSERSADDVAALLGILERKGVLCRTPAGHAFRQALLRAVAYAQLPRKHRIVMHRRAAAWISGLPADQGDRLVHHHRQMIALAANDDRSIAVLTEQANRALTDAGHRAGMAGEHHVAARCYQGALELSHPAPVPDRQRLRSLYRQSLRRVGSEARVR